jgi:hypothetical protein
MAIEPVEISGVGVFQRRFGVWECRNSDHFEVDFTIRIWDSHPNEILEFVTEFFENLPDIENQCRAKLAMKYQSEVLPLYEFWQTDYEELLSEMFPTIATASEITPEYTWQATKLKTVGFFDLPPNVQIKIDRAFPGDLVDQVICFEVNHHLQVTDMSIES